MSARFFERIDKRVSRNALQSSLRYRQNRNVWHHRLLSLEIRDVYSAASDVRGRSVPVTFTAAP